MREIPTIFNGPMVRAILAGTKTQTRRPIKRQPGNDIDADVLRGCVPMRRGRYEFMGCEGHEISLRPPCFPGDRLWVKETFSHDPNCPSVCTNPLHLYYRADFDEEDGWEIRWKPSIHMPRWASRIVREIVSVRIERVQEIDEWGARAEGLTRRSDGPNIVSAFRRLWDSIYGKTFPFRSNPWVWVREFRRIEP